MTTIPDNIKAIGKLIREQNNRATMDPMFCVQVCDRIGPIDISTVDEEIYFYDHNNCITYFRDGSDPIEYRRFELLDDNDLLPEHISKNGYKEQWITVQVCFTEQACQDYIAAMKHRYTEYHGIRIFTDAFFRNEEMQAIRNFLMQLPEATH